MLGCKSGSDHAIPKGPGRTKTTTGSKFTTCREFTIGRHQFPGFYRHFAFARRVQAVVNLGAVVKTLQRSDSLCFWAIPPVRLGLSGRNSGKIPEGPRKRSQSISWTFPREYGWDAPNPIIQGI